VCPTRPTEKPYRLSEPAKRPRKPGLLGRLIPLGFVVALGAYGYSEYTGRVNPQTAQTSDTVTAVESSDSPVSVSFHCDGRTHCSQMTSCAEAEFFLNNCPNVEMDGNNDGEPCEKQWCN
jgi:hypothetical protein